KSEYAPQNYKESTWRKQSYCVPTGQVLSPVNADFHMDPPIGGQPETEAQAGGEVPPLLFQSRTPLNILFGGGHPLFIGPDESVVPPPCQLRTPLHDGVSWRTPLGNPVQLGALQELCLRGGIMSGITGTVPCQTTAGGAG
ncbi:hypothetical protein QTP86_017181, partial [Hemibagrus guttatus]